VPYLSDEVAAHYRREIVKSRIQLASCGLSEARVAELWQVIDCREWFLKISTANFFEQLELVDREIEDALRKTA
jgi:hypothetical protein